MLRIRLRRGGKKNSPFYRIVVAEHSKPIKGAYIENLGYYNSIKKEIKLDKEKILAWLNKGAKPSNTMAKILKKQGLKHKLIVIKMFKAKNKSELEMEKKTKEAEKAKEQAEKQAKKVEFEKESAEKTAKEPNQPDSSSSTGRTASTDIKSSFAPTETKARTDQQAMEGKEEKQVKE